MNKKKVLLFFILAIMIISLLVYCSLRVLNHERIQNLRIAELTSMVDYKLMALEDKISELSTRYKMDKEYYNYQADWGDGFNYLALGNSLTLIEGNWGRGICSTLPDNDYFGIVKHYLEEQYDKVNTYRYNYYLWERSNNRSSMLDMLDLFLSNKIDLITIQLGENTFASETYEKDLSELIDYVRTKCPNAQIILVDDFADTERSKIRKAVAEKKQISFADLSEIIGLREYQSSEGAECIGIDGNIIYVSDREQSHPGDKGMAYIANSIIEEINNSSFSAN